MPDYKHPGVYIDEAPGHPKSIKAVQTAVTAFVGRAVNGAVDQPEPVHTFKEYTLKFGDILSVGDTMGLAVQLFFVNGGKRAVICRIDDDFYQRASAADFDGYLQKTLGKIKHINTIVLPGEFLPDDGSDNPIIKAAVSHCEKMKNRVVIIDPPPGQSLYQAGALNSLPLPASSYAVLYYPWVAVRSPVYKAGTGPDERKNLRVAPSSFAAGIWSRCDEKTGVWKAPAGVKASLAGSAGLIDKVSDHDMELLNPQGINCIRAFPGSGPVLWGARTLGATSDPEFRYISVRRTAIMIQQSIFEGIQWAVFEPNAPPLWANLRSSIGSFMDVLFRAGAFQGHTASGAYFVRCGLGDTMTQSDVDAGRVIVHVGFAPLRPAEFIIIPIDLAVRPG